MGLTCYDTLIVFEKGKQTVLAFVDVIRLDQLVFGGHDVVDIAIEGD